MKRFIAKVYVWFQVDAYAHVAAWWARLTYKTSFFDDRPWWRRLLDGRS